MKDREYIIFCDESDKKGSFYSNFYGGVLVGVSNYQKITERLDHKKETLGFGREVKWQRVTNQYLEKYKGLMRAFFSEIRANRLKVASCFGRIRIRGKRTVAKEKLYKYILSEIRDIYPGFNVGISTGKAQGMDSLWLDKYRHWRFQPRDFVYDASQTKTAKKSKPHRS